MYTDPAITAQYRINPGALFFFVKHNSRALKLINTVFTAVTIICNFNLDTARGGIRVHPVE